jgi:cyclophilin family peptidyl-prolyl cis-trans isomerase
LCTQVAPITSEHILNLVANGLYTTNHFFRVDKGFVAQTADCHSGRTLKLTEEQQVRHRSPLDLKHSRDVQGPSLYDPLPAHLVLGLQKLALITVPLEVKEGVKHHEGEQLCMKCSSTGTAPLLPWN